MITVVGLGNPGDGYRNTRHNAGFMVLDGMSDGRSDWEAVFWSKSFTRAKGLYSSLEGEIAGTRFLLVKPTTYMNESGKAVSSLMTRGVFRDPSELLVVLDDVDTDIGRLRIREHGSAGGHNGLKSIIAALGSGEFARLRVGTGPRPGGAEMVDYVLGAFRPGEYEALQQSVFHAGKCVEAWISGGIECARGKLPKPGGKPSTFNPGGLA